MSPSATRWQLSIYFLYIIAPTKTIVNIFPKNISKKGLTSVYIGGILYIQHIHSMKLTERRRYMNITISYTSDKPMYEQIEDGIKKAIYEGELKNNELLPSVRQLAKDLNVSAITTKRAYIDLEHEGLVYTVSGKGTFVRLDKLSELQKNHEAELLTKLEDTAKLCRDHGIDRQKVENVISKVYDL